MTTKAKKTKPATERNPSKLNLDNRFVREAELIEVIEERREMADLNRVVVARALAQPEVQAATTIQRNHGEVMDVNCLIDELKEQVAEVRAGDMSRPEAMLIAQAHTLDALFNNLARRAQNNASAGYLEASDRYMRLALKAQSQAIRTIEALAEMKNPRPVAFVKQANIANGPQQINNGPMPASRTEETEIPQNKLLDAYPEAPEYLHQAIQVAERENAPVGGDIERGW